MIAELQYLGLTEEEARVYIAVLELGSGPVSVIAKRAGANRVSCYHTVEKLLEKRFLSQYNKNDIMYFSAEHPDHLLQKQEERMNIAKGLIPQLSSLLHSQGFAPKIRFYEGKDGVIRVFEESLNAKGEILNYSNLKMLTQFDTKYFKEYNKKKFEKKIKTRYLAPNTIEDIDKEIVSLLPVGYDQALIEILFVNKEQFLFENDILIFDNSVAIISLNKDERLGLIIESPTFARTMRAMFDLAWLGATAFVAR